MVAWCISDDDVGRDILASRPSRCQSQSPMICRPDRFLRFMKNINPQSIHTVSGNRVETFDWENRQFSAKTLLVHRGQSGSPMIVA